MRKPVAALWIAGVSSFVAGAMAIAGNLDAMRAVAADEARSAALTAIEAAGPGWATLNLGSNREAAWEVRVTRPDGSQADVLLDENLGVLDVRQAHSASAERARDSESGSDDAEEPVAANDADRAARAALDAVGGGRVDDVDRDAEDGATWEVEITQADGTRIDVLLDRQFRVLSVGDERDRNEGADDRDDDRGERDDD